MQSQNKKALFFDIDGTLLDDRTKVAPESAVEALAEAMKQGHLTFICSGRTFCCVEEVARRFPLTGIICGGGTHIIAEGKTLLEYKVPSERGNAIKRMLKDKRVDAVFEASQGTYFTGHPFFNRPMDGMTNHMEEISPCYYDCVEDMEFTFNKICVCMSPGGADRAYEEVIADLETDMLCTKRKGNFHECIPYGYTKATGIEQILKYYRLTYDDAYVFGDSINDITMFRSPAAHRIVMKQHDPALDEYATYFADAVLDDGISKAMKDLGVI